jgi:hypothetical protein
VGDKKVVGDENGVTVGNGVNVKVDVAVTGVTMAVCVSKKEATMVLTAPVMTALTSSTSSVAGAPAQEINRNTSKVITRSLFVDFCI